MRSSRPAISQLAFLPGTSGEGPVVAAGFGGSGWVTLFSLDGDEPERRTLSVDGPVRALAAARVGAEAPTIAVAAKTVRLLPPPEASSTESLPARIGPVRSLAFLTSAATAQGALLATGGADGAIRLWDPFVPRHEFLPALLGHRGKVGALAVLPHPDRSHPLLISAGTDETTIRVWDCLAGEEVLRLVTGAPVTALAVQPPVATGQDSKTPTIVFREPEGHCRGRRPPVARHVAEDPATASEWRSLGAGGSPNIDPLSPCQRRHVDGFAVPGHLGGDAPVQPGVDQ
ncbi:WD40 repeat domain-containing protein [Kitasatospora indigofera]|uniref:WD40 repeat domain-containing protein n=1 Tax=Kitasatospora indigofera TaxID=67307 RepID=UPI0033B92AFD